jgi:lia operon protein LiaH
VGLYKENIMTKYIAKQSLGHFRPGQEIKGLEAKQLQALLASGAVEEYQEPQEPKADGADAKLSSLIAEVAELKANEVILIAGKEQADKDVAELKAKVEALEKSLASSETALKKATAEAKKAASTDK